MSQRLDTAAVGKLLQISAKTVVRYLNESKPGKRYGRNPFPAPDGRDGGRLYWLADRVQEFSEWDGQRAGTGFHFVD